MVWGKLLAFLPCGGGGLLTQGLLRRRYSGVDRGPAVGRHRCTYASPPSQRRGGQKSGYPGFTLGHQRITAGIDQDGRHERVLVLHSS